MTEGVSRIGIYGGTYAPVHNGHLVAARAFVEQMKLDRLLIIPAAIPPHKQLGFSDAPEHRLRMCELAFEGEEKIRVSDIEIARGGRSYTVDTLRALRSPKRKLFLLCGTDMMLTFDQWREFEEIFALSCPAYIRREENRELDAKIIEKNKEYYEKYGVAFRRIVADPVVVSSTDIRKKIRAGEDISDYLPAKVAEYIEEKKLYSE